MSKFIIFPAIDLHAGQVVRLKEGNLKRLTVFSPNPVEIASKWISAGAQWIHIVNLDGAFGKQDDDNQNAIGDIVKEAKNNNVSIQLGGGLRSINMIEKVLALGVNRAVIGTMAVKDPDMVRLALKTWGPEKVAVSLDARDGFVQIHGWRDGTRYSALSIAKDLKKMRLKWLVFTDISRDGLQLGLNLSSTEKLARESGLEVIASGGVKDWGDIKGAFSSQLAGVIVGRALYDGKFEPEELFRYPNE